MERGCRIEGIPSDAVRTAARQSLFPVAAARSALGGRPLQSKRAARKARNKSCDACVTSALLGYGHVALDATIEGMINSNALAPASKRRGQSIRKESAQKGETLSYPSRRDTDVDRSGVYGRLLQAERYRCGS